MIQTNKIAYCECDKLSATIQSFELNFKQNKTDPKQIQFNNRCVWFTISKQSGKNCIKPKIKQKNVS